VVDDRCIQIGMLSGGPWEKTFEECRRYYDPRGISPTLPTKCGGYHEVKIGEMKPVLRGGVGEKKSNGGTQYYQQDRIYSSDAIAMAHPASIPGGSYMYEVMEKTVRVRKLTPKECYRLMDFDDEDYEKAASVCAETNLYKQAGNSIVVAVLEGIFRKLKPYFSED